MIDEQNFPTVVADDLAAGDQIWWHEDLVTVAEVHKFNVNPSYVWVTFKSGERATFKGRRRFPRYVPAKVDDVDPGAWVETVTVEGPAQ